MSNIQSDPIKQMALVLFDLKVTNDALTKRLIRIESRLTQLMLHQGMDNDGRTAIGQHEGYPCTRPLNA